MGACNDANDGGTPTQCEQRDVVFPNPVDWNRRECRVLASRARRPYLVSGTDAHARGVAARLDALLRPAGDSSQLVLHPCRDRSVPLPCERVAGGGEPARGPALLRLLHAVLGGARVLA